MMQPTIAAIIPAYNEAKHISAVLEVLRQVDCLDEILVVDDGSTDGTSEVVRRAIESDPRLRLLQHETNLGKGQAIFTGCAATTAGYILLLDADLVGLTPAHVEALIHPVVERRADMTLGIFRGGRLNTDLAHRLTPWLSGQRCLRAEILDEVPREAAAGYGFETALTVTVVQNGYRTQVVPLRGVWHIPSELHRKNGFYWRLHMYAQILRAWKASGGWKIWWQNLHKRLVLWVSLVMLVLLLLAQYRAQAGASLPPLSEQLPILELRHVHNLMVFAPHPDDETLAAAGAIQIALKQGARIKVVIVTNGDGQVFAPPILEKRARPRPGDYIRLGMRRQAESLAALRLLGVSKQDVVFLGYPDRGLFPMWLADWNTQCPFTAPYTKVSASPYPTSIAPHIEYCGRNLLSELHDLLHQEHPDLIILPHPADQHPDHRALSAYVRMAIALEENEHPDYRPLLWGYLVHYTSFPQPRGHMPEQILLPPRQLAAEPWGQIELSPDEVILKSQAIQKYPSQILLLGKFLPSFARRNELFAPLTLPSLTMLDVESLSLPAITVPKIDPEDISFTRLDNLPVRGNAIVDWQINRLGNTLLLEVQTKRELLPGRELLLVTKLPNGHTQVIKLSAAWPFGKNVHVVQMDLSEWGTPTVIGIAVEMREGRFVISESGWHILMLPKIEY